MRQLEKKFLYTKYILDKCSVEISTGFTYFKESAIDIPINYSYLMMNNMSLFLQSWQKNNMIVICSLFRHHVVTCFITWISTVNRLHSFSIKIPISNSKCNRLVIDKGRIVSKPCILPLGLAVSEARVYE